MKIIAKHQKEKTELLDGQIFKMHHVYKIWGKIQGPLVHLLWQFEIIFVPVIHMAWTGTSTIHLLKTVESQSNVKC